MGGFEKSLFDRITSLKMYLAYEQCLYYFLANKAQHNSVKFGTIHPIATLPPTYGEDAQKSIKVQIGQITLQHFQLVIKNF